MTTQLVECGGCIIRTFPALWKNCRNLIGFTGLGLIQDTRSFFNVGSHVNFITLAHLSYFLTIHKNVKKQNLKFKALKYIKHGY